MSPAQHEIIDFVSEFFASKTEYSKFDSPENRSNISERVLSYRIWPSPTAVKRAVLELAGEGKIVRVDGKNELGDAREAAQASEERDRQLALANPLTPADASMYASLSPSEIAQRCKNDRIWRFRYLAACRLWGFQAPRDLSEPPADARRKETEADVPRTAEEWRRIPTRTSMVRYTRDPKFKAAVDRLIREGQI